MRIARIALGILVLVGCSSNKKAEDTPALGSTSQGIQDGANDTTHTFSVGIRIQTSQGEATCSGTLITPNLVVTARHCVDESPEQIDCTTASFGSRLGQLSVTTNASMFGGGAQYVNVKTIVTPPGNTLCGADVALLILSSSLTGITPAIPGVQYPIDDARYAKRKFDAIGYGSTSPAGGGAGTRRIKQSIPIECASNSDIFQACADLIPAGSGITAEEIVTDKDFISGDATCQGDSGSGAYYTTTDGVVSLGVLSRGGATNPDSTHPNGTCTAATYTRLDQWRDLVVQTAETASNNWTLYPKPSPDWTVFVAAPPGAKDAGTDTGKTTGTGEIGETCSANKDCSTGLCINDANGGQTCSQKCAADDDCPGSFKCVDSYCQVGPKTTPAPATTSDATPSTSTTTSGCSISKVDPEPTPWAFPVGLAAVIGLAASRRRKTA